MQTFEQWWNEIEGYGLRAERFTTPGEAAKAAWDQAMSLRAQADARPCQYPNCGCDSRAKCKSLFTGAPASPKEASAPGLSYAIAWVTKRRDDYIEEFGHIDPDTGALEYGTGKHAEAKREYVGELDEIIEGLQSLTRASAAPVGETSAFRDSVEVMVRMLEEGEWAEHVAATTGKGDPLAQRLETAITSLINEASHD